jgi:hypothetical protein
MYQKQIERLQKLIKHLEYIAATEPRTFNLKQWFVSADMSSCEEAIAQWAERYEKQQPLGCGTSACVVGHLPLVFPEDFEWELQSIPLMSGEQQAYVCGKGCVAHGDVTCATLAEYFGGNSSVWGMIIYEDEYEESQMVWYPEGTIEVPVQEVTKRIKDVLFEIENTPAGRTPDWTNLNWRSSDRIVEWTTP